MGLRQLDDSDDCVFVYDDPDGKEIFAIGIYVDNLQIVHSAELDEDGIPLDSSSFYAKFLDRLPFGLIGTWSTRVPCRIYSGSIVIECMMAQFYYIKLAI